GLDSAAGELQVAAGDPGRKLEPRGQLGRSGEEGSHPAGRQGGREVIEQAAASGDHAALGSPGGGDPRAEGDRRRVAVEPKEDAPSLLRVRAEAGERLE